MNNRIKTRFDEMTLVVKVSTIKPTVVRIKIYDEEKPKIVFTDRYKTVNGQETFYIRMPLTSNSTILSVYDDKKGNTKASEETNVKIVSIEKIPLEKRLDAIDIKDRTVAYFVDFAQKFCYNSAYMAVNKTYQSKNGEFLIEYLPNITGKNGNVLTTPARTSKVTGKIQVSKSKFDNYTVPMKFAILCHEFAHYYINENMDDESEADINGLLIYLGLGYPRIEAYQAFLEVFIDSPSDQNKMRYDRMDKFIKNFEKNKMVLQ
jgi:hypothetical protein